MRQLPPEIINYLNGNSGLKIRQALWIVARNRTTGASESIGLWTGDDTQALTVDGEARTYYGCGQFINFGDMTVDATLNIRRLIVGMTPVSPEMEQAFRGYDAKMARVDAHLLFYNTETNNLVSPPYRFHKGWVDKLIVSTPAVGGSGEARLDIVSNVRVLTNRLAIKRSNDSQRLRQAGDTFFRDVAFAGQVQTPWGSKTVGQYGSGTGGMLKNMVARLRQEGVFK